MSQPTTEQVNTSDKSSEELPPQVFTDEMHEMQFTLLSKMVAERNDLVARFNAASGDYVSLLEQIRENDTDPEIVRLREIWSQAYLDLMAVVEPKAKKIVSDSQGATDEIENQIKTLDSKLKPGLTYFKKMYGEKAAAYFPTQERVKGAIRAGSGGKRVRGFDVTVTIDGEDRTFENSASAAKFIGGDVETGDLNKAFFEKAGVDQSKDAPDTVKVTLEFTEVDGDGNKTEKEAFVTFTRSKKETSEDSANEAPESDEVNEGEVITLDGNEDALSEV